MSVKDKVLEPLGRLLEKVPPEHRRAVHITLLVVAVLVLTYSMSLIRGKDPKKERPPTVKEKVTDIQFDSDVIAKKGLEDDKIERASLAESITQINDRLAKLEKSETGSMQSREPFPSTQSNQQGQGKGFFPKSPLPKVAPTPSTVPTAQPTPWAQNNGQQGMVVPNTYTQGQSPQVTALRPPSRFVRQDGGVQSYMAPASEAQAIADKKKENKKRTIRIASGTHTTATSLHGFYASVSGDGKKNPMIVLLRVNNLAVMPNSVKRDLKGCYVLADGHGDMATSRAYLQLRNLSCMDRKGRAVIDQPVEGYLVDTDGAPGIAGDLIWRGGKALTAATLAGILAGAGKAMQDTTQTSMVGPLGSVQSTTNFDFKNIGVSALGEGVSRSTDELQKFLMDIVRQQFPAVYFGGSKKVSIVFNKKVDLNIEPLEEEGLR